MDDLEWDYDFETGYEVIGALKEKFRTLEFNTPEYFKCISDAWAEQWAALSAGVPRDPYFLDWKFTPIEREAWNCIRRIGLRMYPQCPVGGYFLDFANPQLKIGVELDGRAYHDVARDTKRDLRLWSLGWRIFRITGSESNKWMWPPEEEGFASDASRYSEEWFDSLRRWACQSGDGVLWAIRKAYFPKKSDHPRELDFAQETLENHQLIEFPLGIYPDSIDDSILAERLNERIKRGGM